MREFSSKVDFLDSDHWIIYNLKHDLDRSKHIQEMLFSFGKRWNGGQTTIQDYNTIGAIYYDDGPGFGWSRTQSSSESTIISHLCATTSEDGINMIQYEDFIKLPNKIDYDEVPDTLILI